MKKLLAIITAVLLLPAGSLAQPADPEFINKAIAALQAQRNNALDGMAAAEARASLLTEQLAKAQARLKELEKPAEEKK